MTQTVKNILALMILAGVGLLGYFMFVLQGNTTLQMSDDPISPDLLLVRAREFIDKRQRVDAVNIDTTSTAIFTDARFINLITYTTPVPVQPIGKASLFEPAEAVFVE